MAHCMRHYEEPVAGICRTCQRSFCSRCLVFSFGPKKPPFCVGCALAASGVRNGMKPPPPPAAAPAEAAEEPVGARRSLRAQRRAEKREEKANLKALMRGDHAMPPAEGERDSTVPVPKRLLTPASRFASPTDGDGR